MKLLPWPGMGPLVRVAWRLVQTGLLLGAMAAGLTQAQARPVRVAPDACPHQAQPLDAAALQRLAPSARDHGLLWRIDHAGRSSWLYGTIHVADMRWSLPGPTVAKALRHVDRLALELDVTDPETLAQLWALLQARSDQAPLPPALDRRLAAQRQAACMPQLAGLRPDAQAISLVAAVGRRQGLEPAYGVDITLAALARKLGIPVLALETPQQQMDLLLSQEGQALERSLERTLEQLESGRAAKALATLAQAWAQGNASLLENAQAWCECMDSDEERQAYRRMVDGRNPAMAEAIAAQMRGGHTVFAAVGALHMLGPQGLAALLAQQGFVVQRVLFEAPP